MKKKILLLMVVWQVGLIGGVLGQNVGINSGSLSPDGSAMLDINSTVSGLLIPRMTTAQQTAISSPANGLLIYNTSTNSINNNIGTSAVTNGAAAVPNWSSLWGTSGNFLISSGNQFLGTTNILSGTTLFPISLRFRTNNVERMVIDSSSGYVGIGLTSTSAVPVPTSTLQVNGSFATAVSTYTGNTTLTATNSLILVGTTGITITLPSASLNSGRIYTIKTTTISISVTITPNTTGTVTDKIEGLTSYTLASTSTILKFITIQNDGTNWYIIANN